MSQMLDVARLRRRAEELSAAIAADPRAVSERRAAAAVNLQLALLATDGDRRGALERALRFDPYGAEVYLLLGRDHERQGALQAALDHYEQAVVLAPASAPARLHRGRALVLAARGCADDEQARALADAALADFDAVLAGAPADRHAAFGLLEALPYAGSQNRRTLLASAFARVAPRAEDRSRITRLLYQMIFSFGVGTAKQLDKKNAATMAEIVAVARTWLAAFAGDRPLQGVIAAATAKTDPPERLCERIADYAEQIPDIRVLRLLLRERLAEVADPAQRLALFEQAMGRIPPLDGIAQDYLQLIHLVAKRAAAVGDVDGARRSWEACLARDGDNLAAVENLLRLAQHQGQPSARLAAQRTELWRTYARFSPRRDLVLLRVGATLSRQLEQRMDAAMERARTGTPPSAHDILALLAELQHGHALWRLALDPAAARRVDSAAIDQLLHLPADQMADVAGQILRLELEQEPPWIYGYLDLAKDSPADAIDEALERTREQLDQGARAGGVEGALAAEILGRLEDDTRVLRNPESRAAYDRVTCATELAEFCRAHWTRVGQLVGLACQMAVDDPVACQQVVERLPGLHSPIVDAYLPTTMEGDRLRRSLTRPAEWVVQAAGARQAVAAFEADDPGKALALLWNCYPGHRGVMPFTSPPGAAWAQVWAGGHFHYALRVAEALRQTTIRWFNGAPVYSERDAVEQRLAAVRTAQLAERWARHAAQAAVEAPIDQDAVDGVHELVGHLRGALEEDRRFLSSR